jgi:hypothetical protein
MYEGRQTAVAKIREQTSSRDDQQRVEEQTSRRIAETIDEW